jgi:acyl-CoA synthetase (AMP-forming)/AMP-acid ligase II
MAGMRTDELQHWAQQSPERPALIFPQSGQEISFAALDASANCLAQALLARGLEAGAMIAVLLENRPEIFTIAWAARRAGLYYAMLNSHLKASELGYLLADSGARLLITSRALLAAVPGEIRRHLPLIIVDAGEAGDETDFSALIAPFSAGKTLPERPVGREFLYSSGTSGKPKGILHPMLPADQRGIRQPAEQAFDLMLQRFDPGDVYLSPAPLYHAAPHVYSLVAQARGGTVVVLDKFAPEAALAAIARHGVTHSQWVPTMFVRLLALAEDVRARYDLSTHRRAIHAAAPCPVHVKEKMIAWWGPILVEYYAGSERIGTTLIESVEWLSHKGSVGRAVYGKIHILDEAGNDLPTGAVGGIWFEGTPRFTYHNAAEKTAASFNARGFATYGDLGHLDEEGYLYLSDRRSDLILSGGSNVYPAEIESVLLEHPMIADAAAFGLADDDLGEIVIAAVQPVAPAASIGLSPEAVIAFCRARMSSLKCPRDVIFLESLPRTPTGKLLRRELKERFREKFAPSHAAALR